MKFKPIIICLLSLCLNIQAQKKEEYYIKQVKFPQGATAEQKVDMASRLVPSDRQLAWQQLELTAFLHFGINTFTGREWGDGKEDPGLFDPTALDAAQWVKTLKDAGFKMVILTAKHHDGFCLWPTKTTKHSVASSPWREGGGDVVKELRDACDKYDMKFGVYLSPWDRNAACYGDSPAYNRFFIEQLTELLTNYGEVHEVWFDGANGEGPNGKKQEYDWDAFYSTINRLQPKAVMAVMGDDVRWVGNEKGIGRETEWSATALVPGIYERSGEQNKKLGIFPKAKDLGGRNIIAKADELFWYPSEVDVSIRPGWFYHASQDNEVKSLAKLTDIYFESVGYNSVLLLNIPPDKRGLIHENDAQRLKDLAAYLQRSFADNRIVKGGKTWNTGQSPTKEFSLKKDSDINVLMIREDITKGQRIEAFRVDAYANGMWKEVAHGTTVGYKRLLRFPVLRAEKVRLSITGSRGMAHVTHVAAYYAEPLSETETLRSLSDISISDWTVTPTGARNAIDGNRDTYWKSTAMEPLVVDMGKVADIAGFTYAPVVGENKEGTIYKYNFYVSTDGQHWTKCDGSGEFSNIMHNPIPQFTDFGRKYPARYLKLEPLSEIENRNFITVGEIGVLVR